jgi:hypothetical protein
VTAKLNVAAASEPVALSEAQRTVCDVVAGGVGF